MMENGTARRTIIVFTADFVFMYIRSQMRTSVTGTTTFSRSLTRIMFSYWPLQTRVMPGGSFTCEATTLLASSTKRPTSSLPVSKST